MGLTGWDFPGDDALAMVAQSRQLVFEADRNFPVRISVAVPPNGLGSRYPRMAAWLDETCGADGWVIAPAGMRGVVNDAMAVYFRDATLAAAFVARWCARPGDVAGFYSVRDDDPKPRIPAKPSTTQFGGGR